ncbi:hypothetical protein TPACW86_0177 [Treponema pallidum subsp. pallidum]|nr:hypothetical protein TPAMA_0177 [Treponema pallidum subsp. pallidum str. Mexico A]AGN75391.1 hypothetical protein TPANIC_0177 [Treponema pallidum subsp. pallidum str. Nichols]AGN76367.1 hypothetical protein TPASS_20177 [Treponema pallidum subsp. pallidum SS14]AVW88223.1 hypothetical protein TPAUZ1974_0177 [Treponema pallidum subsp. pallidum]QCP88544.1 hypothetical protein TPACW30_0177 [Treponema pallidum subsp. pallidum]
MSRTPRSFCGHAFHMQSLSQFDTQTMRSLHPISSGTQSGDQTAAVCILS